MEEHKRLFLEKAKALGFVIVLESGIPKKTWRRRIDRFIASLTKRPRAPAYTRGISVIVDSPENEAKVVKWLDTERGSSEAARYCMVCGLIPFTKGNVALVKGDSWYVGGDMIPKEMHKRFINIAKKSEDFWDLEDDMWHQHLELVEETLDGIHVKDGRLKDVKVVQLQKVIVYQTYYTPIIDEQLFTE